MTENNETPILEHLKIFREGQKRTEQTLEEIKSRLSTLETRQASILQRLDQLSNDIERQGDRIGWIENPPP